MAVSKAKDGRVLQIWNDRRPQGYCFRSFGEWPRQIIDVEGIALVRRPPKTKGRPKSG